MATGAMTMFRGVGILELLVLGVLVGVPVLVALIVLALSRKPRHPYVSDNLAPCPDCHDAVSVRAQTCPHCGAPLKPML